MKKQITRKEVVATHQHVLKVGYCSLQNLLKYSTTYIHTAGVYGWNSDIYSFGSVAISTGYRPCGDIQCSYKLCQKYDELALSEIKKYIDFTKLQINLMNLLNSFIDEAIATNGKGYDNVIEKSHCQFN